MNQNITPSRSTLAKVCGCLAALPFAFAGVGLFFLMHSVNSDLKIENPIFHTPSLWGDTIKPNLLAVMISLIPIGIGVVAGKGIARRVDHVARKRAANKALQDY
jgi:hypothetical protein